MAKTIGGSADDNGAWIQQTSDMGYIAGGDSYSNISGNKTDSSRGYSDYWVLKLDTSGNIIWQKTIGGNDEDHLYSVQQTSDGGYFIGGHSASNISGDKTENSNGGFDYWVAKLACYENCIPSATIANKSTLEGNSGTKQLKFPVTLSNAYTYTVKIKYKTINNTAKAGSDYIKANDSLIFKPGQTRKNISITINGDTKVEPDETFYLKLYHPKNATIADDTAIGTIRNDDETVLADEFSIDEKTRSTTSITNFEAYPNPVKDILHIQTKGNAIFYLTNAEGKLILTEQIQNSGSINVSSFPTGLYFLRNGLTGNVQKIIVEK